MSSEAPNWEELNAFVDGELAAVRNDEIAIALSKDHELALQVSALRRLKEATALGAEVAPPLAGLGLHDSRQSLVRYALAASFLLVCLVAGLFLFQFTSEPATQAWHDRGWQLHETWIADQSLALDNSEKSMEQSGILLAGLATLGPQALVPSLDSAKLRLTYVARVAAIDGAGVGLHLGYRGTRGCRLSLFILRDDVDFAASSSRGTRLQQSWQVGELVYFLLADSMDPDRFGLIAEKVESATRAHRAFDAETESVLRRSRAESQPCGA